jgi:hypothetical protein
MHVPNHEQHLCLVTNAVPTLRTMGVHHISRGQFSGNLINILSLIIELHDIMYLTSNKISSRGLAARNHHGGKIAILRLIRHGHSSVAEPRIGILLIAMRSVSSASSGAITMYRASAFAVPGVAKLLDPGIGVFIISSAVRAP